MKTFINGMPKARITRWALAVALLIAVGASVGWMDGRHYQLGGSWIGGNPSGLLFNCMVIPLDPAGRTGALRVEAVRWSVGYENVIAFFGGNTATDGVGEVRMISNNTANWSFVVYDQAIGTAPQITAIEVYSGTWKFTDRDTVQLDYTLSIYPASTDANGDGYPDAGTQPALILSDLQSIAKRVPIE
jgi:hypothetical protein